MANALKQPPCDTSMMGVVIGALDHYELEYSPAEAFVLSGHAFVINIHEELCPSGPYCWDGKRFFELLGNLGLATEQIGTAMPNANADERKRLEEAVLKAMDEGAVCSMLHLENQLVLGRDDEGLHMAQPWDETIASTPARLSFGTWREYQYGPPATFFKFTKREPPSSPSTPVFEALDFAVNLWQNPQQFAEEHYGIGPLAYANWLAAIDAGHGEEHGNWWNGVVWAECRERAGDYFQALAAADYPGPINQEQARQLAISYRAISRLLYRAADKTATANSKRGFVAEARDLEEGCVERMAALRA